MFVYHVCAQKDNDYLDGIAQCDRKIISYDDYLKLKQWVANKMNIKDYETITILSLSFLHEAENV